MCTYSVSQNIFGVFAQSEIQIEHFGRDEGGGRIADRCIFERVN